MGKGVEGIPALKLEVLKKLVSKMPAPPEMFFSNMFPKSQYDSDEIRWEIEYGSVGMTPFVAPGSVAPAIGHDGIGEASAKSAYFKEKMFFDEEFLNGLREPGTIATYNKASKQLAKGVQKLDYRIQRRREWMFSQMMFNGTLAYEQKGGTKFSVSYGVPASHTVTLTGDDVWDGGSTSDVIGDIFDAKTILKDDAGVVPEYSLINSTLLRVLMTNSDLQGLLKSSAFGNGDLFARPAEVLGTLFGLGTLYLYDDFYEIPARLTGNITGGATTEIPVSDASDMEVGGVLRFHNMALHNVYEDEVIASVDVEAMTVTVSVAPTMSFVGGRDMVTMKKKLLGDTEFFMFNSKRGVEPIAEFMEAPFGMGRTWGKYADTKDEWDPDGMWLRVQDKGMTIMYHPDTTFKLITG